jgi:GR25 family glycosyltransferase involved in LPS biosynthesis
MQKLTDIEIDKIYVINMEKDLKRKENTIKTFQKYNIYNLSKNNNVEIRKAEDWTNKSPPKSFRGPTNGGAYGCCISHLKCIDDAIEQKYDTVLIMEDDLMFHNNFIEEWNSISVPNDWNILYLSATQIKWNNIILHPNKKYYKANKSLGGTAYIVKKNLYQYIKKIFFQERKPIDELLIIVQNHFKCLVLYPNLCINYMNESNIRKNNTWKIETTGKKFKWEIDLYDKSIILDENKETEQNNVDKKEEYIENKNLKEQESDYTYKINQIKINKLCKTNTYFYKNAKSHYIILNNKCDIYLNNKYIKTLLKNDHFLVGENTNIYFENKFEDRVEILESIIYI